MNCKELIEICENLKRQSEDKRSSVQGLAKILHVMCSHILYLQGIRYFDEEIANDMKLKNHKNNAKNEENDPA